ncbi:IclR family transcriptional regulator [Amycolatopsis sp. GM8]|uniref:IclR family transcriptional regulator n=1 Tax=Amycolatopsis sp. GM8 TaxID=2896530 RepID=UPI001F377934|nr:IclR family transcriptional regulator [Amycolatopsis sp. GM8]
MSTSEAHGHAPDTSVGKGLMVLDALARSPSPLGISEIAARTGMAKSTIHRLLNTMAGHAYVAKEGERYLLAERVFELGNRVQVGPEKGLREAAAPYVAELFAATRQTIHLAVLSGVDILYIGKASGVGMPKMATRVGGRRPAYATGLGKTLVAFAPEAEVQRNLDRKFRQFTAYTVPDGRRLWQSLVRVREAGFATDNEESFLGVTCLAAPIWSPDKSRAVASISLSSTVSGHSPNRFKTALLNTANQLSDALTRSRG